MVLIGARWRATVMPLALASITCFLWWAGRTLETPAIGSWGEAERWYDRVGPAVAVLATARVAAMVVALWLLAAITLQLLALLLPGSAVDSAVDLVAPRSLQRLVHGLAGLSLTAGLAAPAPSAGIPDAPGDGIAVLRLVDDPPPVGGTATMRVVPEAEVPEVPEVPEPEVPGPEVVVVEAGDSLWSIAEEALIDSGHAAPSDAVVATYWRRVIEQNRDVLVDRSNPDLIYPGQVMTLPSP